jgi:hypothetical protein
VNTAVAAISTTHIDWKLLEALSQKIQGRSVLTSLDRRNITERGLPSLVAALAEFRQKGTDYMSVLLSPGSVLKHIMISFLVESDKETFFELALDGDLAFLDSDNENVMLVSASLYQWRNSIITYGSRQATERQKQFSQAILHQFDRLGLSRLWEQYSRVGNTLVEKR